MTWLRFACPSAARRFVELCDGRSLPLVYLGHLDSHPDLGPLYTIHDGWEELLALLPVQPEPMRRIGYWAARGEERQYPNPASLVDQSADQDRQQAIADLLDDGMHCRAFFGLSPCRLCDDDRNGSTELTDGRYIWPSGLSHYVRDHDVVLPTEVTDALRPCTSIESGRWLIPQIVESMPTSDQRWRELTMPPSL